MKLIIDIPEEIKSYTDKYTPIGGVGEYCFPDEIIKMIQRGTPIPDNATNGDMLQAIFPNCVIDTDSCGDITTSIDGKMYWSKKWWNAPYKVESEEAE